MDGVNPTQKVDKPQSKNKPGVEDAELTLLLPPRYVLPIPLQRT
jgi:hypothetical protein